MHYIITALGCKVNQYEAQAIETLLHAHGFTAAADGEQAGQRRAFRKAPPNWPQRSAPSRRRAGASRAR
jgi:hypothetical protein